MPAHPLWDLSGKRFGRLVVRGYSGKRLWKCDCDCDCGSIHYATGHRLVVGHTRSCGCLRRDVAVKMNTTHGMTATAEFRTWQRMIERCRNKRLRYYKNYGGRGIAVCDRWRESFSAFFSDMGPRPTSEHSIDRIDNNGNYEPGNCRWATRFEQAQHKRNTHLLEYEGLVLPLSEMARRFGYTPDSIEQRLRKGWSVVRSLTTPMREDTRRANRGS